MSNPVFAHQDTIIAILREDGESSAFDVVDRLKTKMYGSFDVGDVKECLNSLVASGIVSARKGKSLSFYRVVR